MLSARAKSFRPARRSGKTTTGEDAGLSFAARARSFRPARRSVKTGRAGEDAGLSAEASTKSAADASALREASATYAEGDTPLREGSISKLSTEELAAWIAAGKSIPRRALAKDADGASLAWAPTAEPRVLALDAVRGEHGQIGLEIRDDFGLGIFNVVVGIRPGSRAEREGAFCLGDVVLEVDGVRLVPEDEALPHTEVRQALRPGKASFRFTVLRAANSQRISQRDSLRIEEAAAANEPAAAAGGEPSARAGGLERIAAAEGEAATGAAGAAGAAEPASTKRFKLNLSAAGGGEAAAEAAPLFTASTPRSLIFAHAAALKNKHLKLARVQRYPLPPPAPPQEAEQACDALAEQGSAATTPDAPLTARRNGRSVDDMGLCV